jgi:hypothetical protein
MIDNAVKKKVIQILNEMLNGKTDIFLDALNYIS